MVASPATEPMYSSLADDDDLADLLELFVEELPDRIETMRRGLAERNYEVVARMAHQLKGALGSYGFGQLTNLARTLESQAKRNASPAEIGASLEQLAADLARCRSGRPDKCH